MQKFESGNIPSPIMSLAQIQIHELLNILDLNIKEAKLPYFRFSSYP
jgi:hypothetical protein